MLHPWALHAYTALCALAQSWPALRTAAGQVTIAASDGLRSTVYGRTSSGGVSDGGMLRAVQAGADEAAHWQHQLDQVADHIVQAYWIARSAAPRLRGGPLATIARALPAASPSSARDIAGLLATADRVARLALRLPPERAPLVGVPCPVCDTRLLQACTSSPHRAAWTVLCGAGCRTDGAPSIWRWTVIAAQLVAPQRAAA